LVASHVDQILTDLRACEGDPFYDGEEVFREIENEDVRNIMREMYGDCSGPELAPPVAFGLTPVFATTSLGLEAMTPPSQRCNPLHVCPDFTLSRSLMICAQCNMRTGFFHENQFRLIMNASIREIGEPMCALAADSIGFASDVSRKFEAITGDPDLEMALLLAIVAWHLLMRSHRTSESERHRQLFIEQPREFKVTLRNLLASLFTHRVNEDPDDPRWRNLVSLALEMAESASLSCHRCVITEFTLLSASIAPEAKLSRKEARVLTKLVFNFSMISFFLYPADLRAGFVQIIFPDTPAGAPELVRLGHCIVSELIEPSVAALSSLVDPQFFSRIAR
jgi:hypothetical protein